jgi:hypothetical protein
MGGASSKPEDIVAIAKSSAPYTPPFGNLVKARLAARTWWLCSEHTRARQHASGGSADEQRR